MILIGTGDGLYRWDEAGETLAPAGAQGRRIDEVVVAPAGDFTVVRDHDNRVLRREGGEEWRDITPQVPGGRVQSLCFAPDGLTLYAGAEPVSIWRRPVPEGEWELAARLHDTALGRDWFTPWGGPAAARTMAPEAADPAQLYVDIHVGGIIRSRDRGAQWEDVDRGLEQDVHEVTTIPAHPGAVYAATADGFYLSEDEGETWASLKAGLDHLYMRGVAVHPRDPRVVLISGSATHPGGWSEAAGKRFALFRSTDGGRRWRRVAEGFPRETRDLINTRCLAFSAREPDTALCGVESGELYTSRDAGQTWRLHPQRLTGIYCLFPVE